MKSIPCPNTAMNTDPLSSIMTEAAVNSAALFEVANLFNNTSTEHTCSIH